MANTSENNLLSDTGIVNPVELDSDYDELHPPDTEDEPDQTPKDEAGPAEIPFTRTQELPLGFNNPIKPFLIPHCSINLEIISVERSPSTHFLNPNLYVIQVQHGEYNWIIKRRYKHFQHLHQELRLFRAKLSIPLPTKKHRDRRKSYPSRERKTLPRFPKKPDALLGQDDVQRRREHLQTYLRNIVNIPIYRKHHETLKFFEIGPISFICELGAKRKEGWVKKRSGGQRATVGCEIVRRAFITCLAVWAKRWMVIKDTFMALIRPEDGAIRAVLLFDQGFHVNAGLMDMGMFNGLQISNLSRHLLIKCWTRRKVREWTQELNDTAKSTARDFTQPNRYESFAPVREHVNCRWFTDGSTYFEAVADALEMAKEEIFIADWWLSPEIYLKRPVIMGETWRLDHILRRKAQLGVMVYVLLFKEVEFSLGLNSLYSKQQLVNMHPNIRVLRHPDHIKGGVLLWSHHEKIVCVDQKYAFLGGLDLCYGRWDDYVHRLTDQGGVTLTKKFASNLSLNVAHIISTKNAEPPQSPDPDDGYLASLDEPRSPSSPNSLTPPPMFPSTSPPVLKSEPTQSDDTITAVEDPKVSAVSEDKDDERTKSGSYAKSETDGEGCNDAVAAAEKKKKRRIHWKNIQRAVSLSDHSAHDDKAVSDDETIGSKPSSTRFSKYISRAGRTKRVVQAVARFQNLKKHSRSKRRSLESIDSLNMGVTWDTLDIPAAELKRSASEVGLAELGIEGSAKLWFGKDYVNFIVKDFVELEDPYKDLVDRNEVPRMPWHDVGVMVQGPAARDVARHFIQRWNFTKFEKAKQHDRYPYLIPKSYEDFTNIPPLPKSSTGSMFTASCQILRSVSSWSCGTKTTEQSIHSAYVAAIDAAQHFIYIENQFFISQAPGNNNVYNEIGEALYRRILLAYQNQEVFRVYVVMPLLPAFEGEIGTATGTAIHAITHWNYASMSRGDESLMGRLRKEGIDPKNYIAFFGLRNFSHLSGKLVTELVYVHSKLMIVDDRVVIMGSANLNDRSMIGKRDSEIAVIVTDEDFEPSLMNGETYNAGRFACTLRRTLFREHLGLLDKNAPNMDIRDPISDKFFKDIWFATAAVNTSVFEKVFHCIPTDTTQTFSELKDFMAQPGLATLDPDEAERQVKKIQGHLVLMPLMFLFGENLQPASGTKESLMPVSLWT